MKEWKIAVHSVCAEDGRSMLPNCEPALRGVLERAFCRLWGAPVGG